MREIIRHTVPGDNPENQVKIKVADKPGPGGANHRYIVQIDDENSIVINFQNGPIKEVGKNGIPDVALVAILMDRLECFQNGPFYCEQNENALDGLNTALYWMTARTRDRIARGVEEENKQ